MLKSLFSAIVLFFASVILMAETVLAIPQIALAQVNPTPPATNSTERTEVDQPKSDRSTANSAKDNQTAISQPATSPEHYDLKAMDEFDSELYKAGK